MTLIYPSRKPNAPLPWRRPILGIVVEYDWFHVITPWFMLSVADPDGALDVARYLFFSGVILQTQPNPAWNGPDRRMFLRERRFCARIVDRITGRRHPDYV